MRGDVIIEMTPGHIVCAWNGRTVRIEGEALMPDAAIQYVIYEHTIAFVGADGASIPVPASERHAVVDHVIALCTERGIRAACE